VLECGVEECCWSVEWRSAVGVWSEGALSDARVCGAAAAARRSGKADDSGAAVRAAHRHRQGTEYEVNLIRT